MTIKLGRLTIELIDDTKPVYKQPRKLNGRFTKDLSEVKFVRGPDRV
jgi:hypothetical protein